MAIHCLRNVFPERTCKADNNGQCSPVTWLQSTVRWGHLVSRAHTQRSNNANLQCICSESSPRRLDIITHIPFMFYTAVQNK